MCKTSNSAIRVGIMTCVLTLLFTLCTGNKALAARIIVDGVVIRNDASTDAGAIGLLDEGDEVTLLDAIQGADGHVWYYMQLENGNTGYIRSDLVDASDEELAAIGAGQPQEEEPAQEEPDQDKPAGEEKPQEATTAATAPAKTGDGEYDATKDPNAAFRVSYETDENGNGEWYVYNDDNESKWKVSDLQGQGGAAAGVKGVSGIWRTLAILFGIIAIALAAFVLFLLKSIREGRSKRKTSIISRMTTMRSPMSMRMKTRMKIMRKRNSPLTRIPNQS